MSKKHSPSKRLPTKPSDKVRTVASAGGPTLVLPKKLLRFWEGCFEPIGGRVVEAVFRFDPDGGPATDYDRACDVRGYLGVIPVGTGTGLVLGDEPLSTGWWPQEIGNGILFRVWATDSEHDIVPCLRNLPDYKHLSKEGERVRFHVDRGPLVIMDSADSSESLDDFIEFTIPAGHYEISTAQHRTEQGNVTLWLHFFTKRSSDPRR